MPRVRVARPDDAAALADLHLDVWDETYTGLIAQTILEARRAIPADVRTGRWRERIRQVPTWVAHEDRDGADELVGFVNAGLGRDSHDVPGGGGLEVMALYVRERVYGTGIGHALLRAALGDRAAYLWVLDGNARAIRFYERQGFAFDGATKIEHEGLERRMVRG